MKRNKFFKIKSRGTLAKVTSLVFHNKLNYMNYDSKWEKFEKIENENHNRWNKLMWTKMALNAKYVNRRSRSQLRSYDIQVLGIYSNLWKKKRYSSQIFLDWMDHYLKKKSGTKINKIKQANTDLK